MHFMCPDFLILSRELGDRKALGWQRIQKTWQSPIGATVYEREGSRMNLASKIDHTMLKADCGKKDIQRYCAEALEYGFASVCVNSGFVPLVAQLLKGSEVKTCCVVGFPLGAMSTKAKADEARFCVTSGAEEVDMVINISALKDGDYDLVKEDIEAVVHASKPAIVKVIIETCLLDEDEKKKACELSMQAGAAFVKTSTGFSTGGATVSDIRLMKSVVGDTMQIKASGGIRTKEFAMELLEAGADRIGAGNGIALL